MQGHWCRTMSFPYIFIATYANCLLPTTLNRSTQTSQVWYLLKAVGLYSHKHEVFSDHNVRLNFISTETKCASSVLNCSSCFCGHSFEKVSCVHAFVLHAKHRQELKFIVFKSAPLLSCEEGRRILNN